MWFGNRGGGAVRYNTHTNTHQIAKFDHNRSAIVNDIFTIHQTQDKSLWFGTSGGLIQVARDTTLVPGITNTVHGILDDRKGDLWLSTNRGLVQYTPHTGNVVTYGYSYGLNTIEYSDGAYFTDPQTGLLFFGGINGCHRRGNRLRGTVVQPADPLPRRGASTTGCTTSATCSPTRAR